jgi:N-ethylmaleimide reductase
VFTPSGRTKAVTPRALESSELPGIVEQFRHGADTAKAAGFDGVELHGANGYLLDQFLRDGSNQRDDAYGGSVENRARLPLEVTEAVVSVWGPERVGYRVSPTGLIHSMSDSNPLQTFTYLARELSALKLGYLHVLEAISGDVAAPPDKRIAPALRRAFPGTLIVNGGYDRASAAAAIDGGDADLVAFGVPFLANPDLPTRLLYRAPLNQPDSATFYAGDERGYTDYPALAA